MYHQLTVSGLPAISIANEAIEAIVVPAVGCKITNLRRRRGREWLWRNPAIPLALPGGEHDPETVYVDQADSGGWDECFPTVGPSSIPGAPAGTSRLPDHGELWSAPWSCTMLSSVRGTTLSGVTQGRLLPCEFRRDLTVDPVEPVIHLDYQVRHLGGAACRFVWAGHPLLNVQPGSVVQVDGMDEVSVISRFGAPPFPDGVRFPWPPRGADRFRFEAGTDWAAMVFGELGADLRAVVTDPAGGERFELTASGSAVTHLGLWLNAGGWAPRGRSPYYNLAVEPCLGAPDRLDRAVDEWNAAPWLEAGTVRGWRVTVALREGSD
jgi:galactose mutarotase-like enzyme